MNTAHPFAGRPVHRVIAETARQYGLPVDALTGPGRTCDLTLPRHVAMHIARERLTPRPPLSLIANAFRRDTSTVMHGVQRIGGLLDKDPYLRAAVGEIVRRLERPPSRSDVAASGYGNLEKAIADLAQAQEALDAAHREAVSALAEARLALEAFAPPVRLPLVQAIGRTPDQPPAEGVKFDA